MISVIQLGQLDYSTGLDLQSSLVRLRQNALITDVLLLLEHTPVITRGRNAKPGHLLASPALLSEKGVELFDCDRGGDITFHGPGQVVGYPIFDLRAFTPRVGAVQFVRRIEEVLIRACAALQVPAQRIPGLTGVWTRSPASEPAKVAAIGVHISRGVTSHGFALNVNNDLDYFKLIVPCGIQSRPVTSIARELGRAVPLDDVAQSIAAAFAEVFATDIRWVRELAELTGASVGLPARPPAGLRRLAGDEDLYLG